MSGSQVNLQFSTNFVAIEVKISSIINFTKTKLLKLLKQISSVYNNDNVIIMIITTYNNNKHDNSNIVIIIKTMIII